MRRDALKALLACLVCAFSACTSSSQGTPSDKDVQPPTRGKDGETPPSQPTQTPPDQQPNQQGILPGGAPAIPANPDDDILYRVGQVHSPITPAMAERLRRIAARDPSLDTHAFMKVGDSITASESFLDCFAPEHQTREMNLAGNTALLPTIDWFSTSIDSFGRRSLSASPGVTAEWVLRGSPSPLQQEIDTIKPRLAVVMYGTNDANYTGSIEGLRSYVWRRYSQSLFAIVDSLTERGVVPVLSTIPHRKDRAAQIPTFNAIVRAIAQAEQIPVVDYNLALQPLPEQGLSGDGVHPNIYNLAGVDRGCILTDAGLQFGYNQRNLVTLQAITRLHQVVTLNMQATDETGEKASGSATFSDPLRVTALPFVDARERPGSSLRDGYARCGVSTQKLGAESVYQFRLDAATPMRAIVLGKMGFEACRNSDLDCSNVDDNLIVLLKVDDKNETCIEAHNTEITRTLDAGDYRVVVDTTALDPSLLLFVLQRCEPDDAQCL